MTVKQLIEKLSACDPCAEVFFAEERTTGPRPGYGGWRMVMTYGEYHAINLAEQKIIQPQKKEIDPGYENKQELLFPPQKNKPWPVVLLAQDSKAVRMVAFSLGRDYYE